MRPWLPPLLWTAVIFLLSSTPRLSLPPVGILPLDKAAHFAEYLILGLLFRRSSLRSAKLRRRSLSVTAGLTVLAAFLDELHQIPIPGRFWEIGDLAADWAGGVLGALLWPLAFRARGFSNALRRFTSCCSLPLSSPILGVIST